MNNIVNVNSINTNSIINICYEAKYSEYEVSGYMGYDSGYREKVVAKGSFECVKHLKDKKNITIKECNETKSLTLKNYLKNVDFNEPIYSFSILEKIPDKSSNSGFYFTSCINCGFSYRSDLNEHIGAYKDNNKYKIEIKGWEFDDYTKNLLEIFLGDDEITFYTETNFKNKKKLIYRPYNFIKDEITNIVKMCSENKKVSRNRLKKFSEFAEKVYKILEECYNSTIPNANYKNYIYSIDRENYTGLLTYEAFRECVLKHIPEEYRNNRASFKGYYSYYKLLIPVGKNVWCPNEIEIEKAFQIIIEFIEENIFTIETDEGFCSKLNTDKLKTRLFHRLYNNEIRNYIESQKDSFDRRYAENHIEILNDYFNIPKINLISDEMHIDMNICIFDFRLFKLKLSQLIKEESEFKYIEQDIIKLLSETLRKLETREVKHIMDLLPYEKFLSDDTDYYWCDISIAQNYATIDCCELDDIKVLARKNYGYTLYKYSDKPRNLYNLEGYGGINYLEESNIIHGALKEL